MEALLYALLPWAVIAIVLSPIAYMVYVLLRKRN